MEKKPIRRNEHIAKLSRDHHASLMFCWKIRQGIKLNAESERMTKYVAYFLDHHFLPHFKEEEEILFVPVQDNKVQKAIDDHVVIRKMAGDIIADPVEKQKSLTMLADLVDDHVRYEERILFPFLENELSEEQLENIGSQLAGEPAKDTFEDEFWVKRS